MGVWVESWVYSLKVSINAVRGKIIQDRMYGLPQEPMPFDGFFIIVNISFSKLQVGGTAYARSIHVRQIIVKLRSDFLYIFLILIVDYRTEIHSW